MLACRVPFFSTMLYGRLPDKLASDPVPLDCCDSVIFKHILKFVFQGEIYFNEMDMQTLLDLLETSRLFCLEFLVEGVVNYLKCILDAKNLDFKDCLVALQFTNVHKFPEATESLFHFIDKHCASIFSLPEFDNLSESSVKLVLSYSGKVATEIERFKAFAKWLESKEDADLSVDVKNEMLGWFDLRKFSRKDLVKVVMKSNLFDDKEICLLLEEDLEMLEGDIRSKDEQIRERNAQIKIKQISLSSKKF